MKTLISVILISWAVTIGCASSDKSAKSDKQQLSEEEKAQKATEARKLEDEKNAKEKEELAAKEELERRKAESEKNREELGAVKERLKQMGMAAVYVPVTKDGNTLSYPGGRVAVIRSKVGDAITLRSLNDVMQNQIEKSNSDLDRYNTGYGGFETCLRGQLFVLYMSRDKNGMVVREWYETLDKCN